MSPFNVETVEIKGSNLIEASAGTGKTYSIAILTLRLILENNIPISEILMVTFTNAAVAELETRIREFVGKAYKESIGQSSGDNIIRNVVLSTQNKIGIRETTQRLKNAILFLDETSIMTMHGFCQRTLSEFAFETGQVFGAETLSSDAIDVLITDFLNDFWRKQITTMDISLLKYIVKQNFNQKALKDVVDASLSGKKLLPLADLPLNFLSFKNQAELLASFIELETKIQEKEQEIFNLIEENHEDLLDLTYKNTHANKIFPPLFENYELLLAKIIEKRTTGYVKNIFNNIITMLPELDESNAELVMAIQVFMNQLYQLAIQTIEVQFEAAKQKESFITFNDMIVNVHKAVYVQKQHKLLTALRKKYQAAFIDEFQDTDRLQFEIFHTIFKESNILFYIGDPKQSIYGWRKADIFTYFEARNSVDHQYEMNTNFRSSASVINALNSFFLPEEDFDTFYYNVEQNLQNRILYSKVHAPENEKGTLLLHNDKLVPLTIIECNKIDEINQSVAATVVELLSNPEYVIVENNVSRPIKPSDFGILVRTNNQARAIKESLTAYKIPSVTIDESKLLTTEEANEMLFVLKAVVEIQAGNINKALLTSLTGFTINQVLELDEEHILNQFKLYQQIWLKNGVYVMLLKFISDFRVKSVLLNPVINNGERKLSNVLQLAELLHKISIRKQYMPTELINWLNKGIEGKVNEGDEFEQRIENDEDAVKIISIHKCKGLEYNIVLAPFLDLNSDPRDIANFREEDGTYWFTDLFHLTEEQLELTKTQAEQENRRLLYVALTRAKYKCYIHRNIYYNESALSVFTNNPNSYDPNLIEYIKLEDIEPIKNLYADKKTVFAPNYAAASNFSLLQPNWMKLSYTFLSPDHHPITKFESTLGSDDYSRFVFNQLKRGAHTGNLLHYIFEHIDFTDDSRWEKTIQQALKRLSGIKDDNFVGQLVLMLRQVLNTKIATGETSFSLNQIKKEKRLDELEFDMLVPELSTNQLQDLSNTEHPFNVKNITQLEGMLNGRVDLFFEHDGKFYILDWKSNFLGNDLEDYNAENIKFAMKENNYNLQYLIYTIALVKYLGTRKIDFDYEKDFGGVIYLFVRGVREDGSGGIFFCKPQLDLVENISALLSK